MQEEPKKQWADHRDTRDNVPCVSVTIQGKLLEYKFKQHYQGDIGGTRKEITSFSDAARLRMIKHLYRCKFDPTKLPLFVTLTYPDECAYNRIADRNIHRKVFARHLERLMGKPVPAAWRLEWTIRQSGFWAGCIVPHWHLLIWRIGFIPYQEINRLWAKTIGHEGHVQTDIQRMDKRGGVQGYMAKYISKEAVPHSLVFAAYQNSIGRQYGWLRKALIPLHDRKHHDAICGDQIDAVVDLADQMVPWARLDERTSFSLFGEAPQDFDKILRGLPLTKDNEPMYTKTSKGGDPVREKLHEP